MVVAEVAEIGTIKEHDHQCDRGKINCPAFFILIGMKGREFFVNGQHNNGGEYDADPPEVIFKSKPEGRDQFKKTGRFWLKTNDRNDPENGEYAQVDQE